MRGRVRERWSALRVLWRLPGLLQAVLLALLDAGIPGKEARPLQGNPVFRVDQRQGTCDPQPQRTRLAGDPAAGDAGGHVELPLGPEGHERLIDELLKKGKSDLVSFMTYPGEFHYFTREHVLRDAWHRVEDFFNSELRTQNGERRTSNVVLY